MSSYVALSPFKATTSAGFIAEQLMGVGFARFDLPEAGGDVVATETRKAVTELTRADAFSAEFSVPGTAKGLGAGFHYFPTNDPNGRPQAYDGEYGGLLRTRTWDQRGGTNPAWPRLTTASSALDAVTGVLAELATWVSEALASVAGLAFASRSLAMTRHDGAVLRVNVSRGTSAPASDGSQSAVTTRHIWHSDATLWTLLCLEDFSREPRDVSATDRLVYEADDGRIEVVPPQVGSVILFPGRHVAALMDVSPPLRAWRHAVASRSFSERTVVMLRVGFDPAAPELRQEGGRPLRTRDGVDVSSGSKFYQHLAALRGAPLVLDGSPRVRYGRRGSIEGSEVTARGDW